MSWAFFSTNITHTCSHTHTLSASEKHCWEKCKTLSATDVSPGTGDVPTPSLPGGKAKESECRREEMALSKFANRNTMGCVGSFLVCMETHLLPSDPRTLDQLQQQLSHQSGSVPQDHYCQCFSWYAPLAGTKISIPQPSNDFLSLYKGFSIFTILMYGKYSERHDMTTKQRFGQYVVIFFFWGFLVP